MLVKTKAVVLRTVKYGDSRLIIDLLTEQVGRLSCIVTIPKTARGRNKKQYYQPMTLLDIEFDQHPQADLQRIRDVRIAAPYTSVPFDNCKLPVVLFLSEFLYYATRDEQQNPALYAFVETSMRWLDAAHKPVPNFHLVFMIHLSRFVGFFPNLDDYHEGCLFDLRSASFTAVQPIHPDFVSAVEASYLLQLMRMNYATMHLFRLSRAQRQRILEILLLYYRLHLPQMPELRSPEVLSEVFN